MISLRTLLPIAALALLTAAAACSSTEPTTDAGRLRQLQDRRLITARAERDALLRQQAERRRIHLHQQWQRIQSEGARRLAELQAREEALDRQRQEAAQRRWRALQ